MSTKSQIKIKYVKLPRYDKNLTCKFFLMRIETILRYFLIKIVPMFRFSTYACINTIYNFF